KTVANALNKPSAARAVGTAIGKNPLPIFIPCHRVIGSNGSLTGFSGGIDIKRKLLALENEQYDLSL
ncbi:MAG: MGMT family protein, partial [Halieaceae bacterium]